MRRALSIAAAAALLAAAPAAAAETDAYGGIAQQRIGTGHGQREWSPVGRTDFVRATRSPEQVSELRYDDEATLVARATSALYSERTGGFTGVLDDPGVARELQWQRDDINDLLAGVPADPIRSRAATAATLLRAGITTGDWSGRLPGLDETPLF